jgi:uncharacterized membrane protein YkoI
MIVVAKVRFVLPLSIALAVASIPVFARQSEDTSVTVSTQELVHSESAGTFKGANVFENVRVPIRRAIAIAEARAAGANVVDIGFDEESDRVAYKVKTYQHNEIWTGTIDGSTGEIIGEGVITPVTNLEGREKHELANFKVSGMDLSEAIAIAEKYGAGTVFSAGLEEQNGKPIFAVVVVADGRLKEVVVEMVRPCRFKKRSRDTRRFSANAGGC